MTVTDNRPRMGSVPSFARKYKDRGVSEWAIREWVKKKAFPTVKAGNKTLINEAVFEAFLNGENL